MVQASSDWIEWAGGKLPLDPQAQITVRYRDGTESRVARKAGEYKSNFRHEGNDFDIIAYRVVQA